LRQAIKWRGPVRLPTEGHGEARELMLEDRSNAPVATAPTSPAQAGSPRPDGRRRWLRVARELGLVAVFALIYEWIGAHLVQAGGVAASHALAIVAAERTLGIFHEQAVQAVFIHNDTITDAFNAYYGGTHFLIPAFVLVFLLWRHPGHYGRARTALALMTGAAFVVFWLFPVAPPRMLPARFGILDMLTTPDGSGHFETSLINTAGDRYASMPSLHVAWAVWCALALYPVVRSWLLRALIVGYPLMTTLVVVATGNHFFLDALAGTGLAVATWVAVTRIGAWASVRRGTRALARHHRGCRHSANTAQQREHLAVELFGHLQGGGVPVAGDLADHAVVGDARPATGPLLDEDGHRGVRARVGDGAGHPAHGDRVAGDQPG
jgi:PAP2 superfamily